MQFLLFAEQGCNFANYVMVLYQFLIQEKLKVHLNINWFSFSIKSYIFSIGYIVKSDIGFLIIKISCMSSSHPNINFH